MGYCKPYYEDYLKPENVDATIVIDSKLSRSFKNKYKKKTCGTLAFLANKVFTFDSPSKGVYLLDVRLKNTFSNGTITYQSIFTPEKDRFVNLRTQEGLDLLLSLIPQSNSELFESMPMIGYGNDTVSDLIDLYRIFSLFDYVNIADYSCRTIYSKKKITGRRMAYMYSREQDAIDEMTSFGGKYKKKTQRKNRPVRKTVKSR
jgi:hypothetical protein